MIFFNLGVMPIFRRYGLTATFVVAFTLNLQAQISGVVFRDYNGNGTRENTPTVHKVIEPATAYKPGYVEPLVAGVIVTAYGANDVILASVVSTNTGSANYIINQTGTPYNGTKGSNTGFVPNGTAVRLEFTFFTDGGYLPNSLFDFSSKKGKVYGSSVRFLSASSSARTGHNFAFNNPNDNVVGSGEAPATNTNLFQVVQFAGSGTTGTSATQNTLVRFPYLRDGNPNLSTGPTGTLPESITTAAQTGSVYGLAYSKQAQKVFMSAYMKRHSGFGPVPGGGSFNTTPGTIYMVNPTTKGVTVLTSLDALGYPTHNYDSGAPTYGSVQHYTLENNGVTNDNSGARTETIKYTTEAGIGVIGSNTQRSLPNAINTPSYDAAAFGQVGRVSLGEIELSDDGKYLFVVNLYDRKVYQLQLNSITNPTSATYVNSWALPNPPARSTSGVTNAATIYASETDAFYSGAVGRQRPFALKYYRGKLYVGATTTGEATPTTVPTTGNAYTDLWGYVWELTPSQGFQKTTPVLQFPLNYARGTNSDGFNEQWRPWTNTIQIGTIYLTARSWGWPQAMFADIEFDDTDGSMILGFRDRTGDQGGYFNYMFQVPATGGTIYSRTAVSYGDQLRAYRHVKADVSNPGKFVAEYQLESNGKEGAGSSKAAVTAAQNGQGPGGGEFYYQDGLERYNAVIRGTSQPHLNTAMGGLALLPGMEEVAAVYMDPLSLWSGGVSWMNNVTGANTRDYQIYGGASAGQTPTAGAIGKANGLGDIELLTVASNSLEIGNRIWKDTNGDGIQGADEPGIGGVLLELVNSSGTVIATVTTATDGSWYFTTDTGTDETGVKYGVDLLPSTSYTVRLATSGEGNDWDPTANSGAGGPRSGGALVGLSLTKANEIGNGEEDLSDSDATLVDKIPSITFTTGGYGENNHTLDIGFVAYGSIGDYVWYDTNYNGAQDGGELPAQGVTVTLWKSMDEGITWNENFATTTTNSVGYYHFGELLSATYKVVFTKPAGYEFTKQNHAPATDLVDSDVNVNGHSQNVSINVSLTEDNVGRNNPTIDAGLVAYGSIGDKVWYDTNRNGKQDVDETPVVGVTVNLWRLIDTEWKKDFATQNTDANGNYLFANLESGTYKVEFIAPTGSEFTYFQKSGVSSTENSDAGTDGLSDDISIDATLAVENIGRNNPTIDAGLVPEGALPVSLLSFAAKVSDEKTVNLTWTTTMETNSAYFDVERSTNGKSWSSVSRVSAKGESTISHSYNLTDFSPLNGRNYYRLKMVDRSGEFAFSKLESVELKGLISINVYPNPTSDNFRISTASGIEVVEVSIYSGVGRLVTQIKNPAKEEIDIKHLPQGAYVVKIVTKDGTIETRKLILRK